MNNLEQIKRHLGRKVPIKITNVDGASDIFYFNSLNISQQAILMELGKQIKNKEEIEIEIEKEGNIVKEKVPNLSKEDIEEMFELIKDVVKTSLEELDELTLNDFCNTNFNQLSDALFKLMPENQSKKDLDSLKKAKERIESGQKKTP